MISETVYYLGGHNSASVYADPIYEYERGTKTVSSPEDNVNRTMSWRGKVALPYVSDYGYAADLNLCTSQLSSYSDATCTENNWMFLILKTTDSLRLSWFINPNSDRTNFVYSFLGDNVITVNAFSFGCATPYNVFPVLYLNPDTVIEERGDVNNPYKILVK